MVRFFQRETRHFTYSLYLLYFATDEKDEPQKNVFFDSDFVFDFVFVLIFILIFVLIFVLIFK